MRADASEATKSVEETAPKEPGVRFVQRRLVWYRPPPLCDEPHEEQQEGKKRQTAEEARGKKKENSQRETNATSRVSHTTHATKSSQKSRLKQKLHCCRPPQQHSIVTMTKSPATARLSAPTCRCSHQADKLVPPEVLRCSAWARGARVGSSRTTDVRLVRW